MVKEGAERSLVCSPSRYCPFIKGLYSVYELRAEQDGIRSNIYATSLLARSHYTH